MTSEAMRPGVRRPLLGFGPWGVLALIVLAALVVVAVRDINLWGLIFGALYDRFGVVAVFSVLNSWTIPNYLAVNMPVAGPLCLLYILPALHIAPGRRPWWMWTVASVAMVAAPSAWYSAVTGRLAGTIPPYLGGDYMGFAAILNVAAVAGLWLITRSLLVAGIGGVASVACCWSAGRSGVTGTEILIANWSWHLALAGSLLTWAIVRRMRQAPPGSCGLCGYDCRGVAVPVCPECGAPRALALTGSPSESGQT